MRNISYGIAIGMTVLIVSAAAIRANTWSQQQPVQSLGLDIGQVQSTLNINLLSVHELRPEVYQ